MPRLTKKKAVQLHRQLWDWLYKNPVKEKKNWPEWEKNGGTIESVDCDCFACEYDMQYRDDCSLCLFGNFSNTACLNGLFSNWDCFKNTKVRKKYAKLIRDLPERK